MADVDSKKNIDYDSLTSVEDNDLILELVDLQRDQRMLSGDEKTKFDGRLNKIKSELKKRGV